MTRNVTPPAKPTPLSIGAAAGDAEEPSAPAAAAVAAVALEVALADFGAGACSAFGPASADANAGAAGSVRADGLGTWGGGGAEADAEAGRAAEKGGERIVDMSGGGTQGPCTAAAPEPLLPPSKCTLFIDDLRTEKRGREIRLLYAPNLSVSHISSYTVLHTVQTDTDRERQRKEGDRGETDGRSGEI